MWIKNVMSVPTKGLVSKSVFLPVTIHYRHVSLVVTALIDSRAEGNFLRSDVVAQLQFPVQDLQNPLKLWMEDQLDWIASPLSLNLFNWRLAFYTKELLPFLIIDSVL